MKVKSKHIIKIFLHYQNKIFNDHAQQLIKKLMIFMIKLFKIEKKVNLYIIDIKKKINS